MAMTITIAALQAHDVCHMDVLVEDLTTRLGYAPADDDAISVEVWCTLPP